MTERLKPFLLAIIIPALVVGTAAAFWSKEPVISALWPEIWALLAVAVVCLVMMVWKAGKKESFVWMVLIVLAMGLAFYAQWQNTIVSVIVGIITAVGTFLLLSSRGRKIAATAQVASGTQPTGSPVGNPMAATILEQIKVGLGGGAATVDVSHVVNKLGEYASAMNVDAEAKSRAAALEEVRLARELMNDGHLTKEEFAAKAREILHLPVQTVAAAAEITTRKVGASGFPGIKSTKFRGKQ